MFRLLVLAFLVTNCRVSANCEYGRSSGFFKNKFINDGEDDFVPDDGEDALNSYGDSTTVTFTNKVNIFSAQVNTLKIYDSGLIFVDIPPGGAEVGTYTSAENPFTKTPGQSFIEAFWFSNQQSRGVRYKFTYKHLKRSDLMDGSGLATGPSFCDLQRVENMIFDCNDAGQNLRNQTGDNLISEALIVTWETSDVGQVYHMQVVVAIDGKTTDNDRETYVIFLYEHPKNIPGDILNYGGMLTAFINGLYSTEDEREFAAVCPFVVADSAITAGKFRAVHISSNCRCGSWNEGTYVFRTRDDQTLTYLGNTCLKTAEADLIAECDKSPTDDDTMLFQLACRPSRLPQDTCIEDIYCAETSTTNQAEVTITMHQPAYPYVIFLDYNDILTNTITLQTAASCKKLLTDSGNGYYTTTITIDTTSPVCGFNYTAASDELNFALMSYDINDGTSVKFIKSGSLILKGTCEILDKEARVDVDVFGLSIPTTTIAPVTDRKVEMFVNDERNWDPAQPESRFLTSTEVDLARDIYLAVCYNWGSRAPFDNAEPYGVYVTSASVSNNADFLVTDDNRVQPLIENRCRNAYSQNAQSAFYVADHFKEVFYSETISTTDFNHCQMTGALHAAKWLVGGSDTIYFRANVGFCRTKDLRADSQCSDSCGGAYVDYPAGRKRRDVNVTSEDVSPYPEITLETSIRILKQGPAKTAEQIECVSSTVAISTTVALMVLLLFAIAIAAMLFCKVKSRQKKE